jgi:signal transduction histidine kinase
MKKDDLLHEQELYTRIEIQERSLQAYVREIYENISQVLSLVRIQLLSAMPGQDLSLESAKDNGELVGKAISDLRNLTKQLSPEQITRHGFVHAIDSELQRLQEAGLCDAGFFVTGNYFSLGEVKELVVFCILQQLIYPLLNHREPGRFHVLVQYDDDKVVVDFAMEKSGVEIILANEEIEKLQKRVELMNGTILNEGRKLRITLNK